jgi:hypothetical protein
MVTMLLAEIADVGAGRLGKCAGRVTQASQPLRNHTGSVTRGRGEQRLEQQVS